MSDLTRCQLVGLVIGGLGGALLWFGLGWQGAAFGVAWGAMGIATLVAFVRQHRRLRDTYRRGEVEKPEDEKL